MHAVVHYTLPGACVSRRGVVSQPNPNKLFAKVPTKDRKRSTVVAYRDNDRLTQTKRSAEWFPTVLNTTDLRALPNACSTDHKHHTSIWHRELVENHGRAVLGPGVEDYEQALEAWRDAYPIAEEHLHLVVAQEEDAFLMSIMSVQNSAGAYLGQEPTGNRSAMAAAYRLNLNEQGRVAGSWVYRSGTKEEHQALLRHPGEVDDLDWIQSLTIYPCTWEPTEDLKDRMTAAVNTWVHDIWTKGDMKKITQLMAPDVVLYDCVGIGIPHKGPVVGERGIRQLATNILETHDVGGMVPLAIAQDGAGNQVFLHWTQCLMQKVSGEPCRQSGITLFVFDHEARVVQMLQFGEPLESTRQSLYQERHLMRMHE